VRLNREAEFRDRLLEGYQRRPWPRHVQYVRSFTARSGLGGRPRLRCNAELLAAGPEELKQSTLNMASVLRLILCKLLVLRSGHGTRTRVTSVGLQIGSGLSI
jgi:hypothetical protein